MGHTSMFRLFKASSLTLTMCVKFSEIFFFRPYELKSHVALHVRHSVSRYNLDVTAVLVFPHYKDGLLVVQTQTIVRIS